MVLDRVGLTGATGMLGRHVKAALENAGACVLGVSRTKSCNSHISQWDLENWLTNAELDKLFDGVQVIVHVGAMVPLASQAIDESRLYDANVRSCLNLGLWAIAKSIPLVFVSGAIVYKEIDRTGLTEHSALGPNGLGGFYGFSKLLAEDVFRRLEQQGLTLAIVRPASIYGHGLPAEKMITRFLTIANQGGTIELAPPVNDRIDFIHAADVAHAILAILKADAWDKFNIASGVPLSIKELAENCVLLTGRGRVTLRGNAVNSVLPLTRYALNTDLAGARLGWRPRLDIQQGLRMMLQESLLNG